MDVRIGGQSRTVSLIRTTSPDPDSDPPGSQAGGHLPDRRTSGQNTGQQGGFDTIVDGPPDAQPTVSDTYLTAMYLQYVDYRGPRRGTVENPFAPGGARGAQTVPMTLPEGIRVDRRV